MLFAYGSSQFEVIRCIRRCKLRYALEIDAFIMHKAPAAFTADNLLQIT